MISVINDMKAMRMQRRITLRFEIESQSSGLAGDVLRICRLV